MKFLHIRNLDGTSAKAVDAITSTCASRQEIQSALRSGGLGYVTAWVDALSDLDWDTQLVVRNSPTHLSRITESYGAPATGRSTDDLLATVAEKFSPKVIMVEEPEGYSAETLAALKTRCRLLVASSSKKVDHSKSLASVDLFLSGSTELRQSATRMGAREALEFYVGSEWEAISILPTAGTATDIIFCGAWDNQHTTRNWLLLELSKGALGWHGGFSVGYHITSDFDLETMPIGVAMHVTSGCSGEESVCAVARAKIAIYAGPDSPGLDVPEDFVFDATSRGILLLTAPFMGLEKFFEPGKEVETFNSAEEMVKRVRWFLDNEAERASRAAAGQARYVRQHSLRTRIAALSQELLARL